MASESPAFYQLEQLVRGLGDELSAFRKRAQVAESRVRVLEAAVALGGDEAIMERLRTLEAENAELLARLTYATQRSRQLVARVKFMRQQLSRPVAAAAGASE